MDQDIDNKQKPSIENDLIIEKITKTNGEVTIKKYSKGKPLGKGGFAVCYEITNIETNEVSAAKIISKSSLNRSRAKQKLIAEIKIHKSLSHANIVKFLHVFQDHENVYILLEVCTNRTLNELIKRRKRLTQGEVQYYVTQICSSLIYLQENKIIHRDLKLGNLFLNQNMQIKLGDFGLATRLENNQEKKKTICGTPNYIAPQILLKKGHSYEVDIWSVGTIIYTQLIGKPPFQTSEVKTTYKKIKDCNYNFPQHVVISDHAKSLICRILVLDPSKRPTLEEILEDPFMTTQIPKPIKYGACPPSKSLIDQYKKSSEQRNQPQLEKKQKNPISKNQSQKQQIKSLESIKKYQQILKDTKQSNKTQQPEIDPTKKIVFSSQIHVKKWVDYSNKYGLGYLLSNGSTGVYFNDTTKIVLDRNGQYFQYIEKKTGEKYDSVNRYKLVDFPSSRQLHKKIALLQHFRMYLNADEKTDFSKQLVPQTNFCYVKKWMKTKNALIFRLNNKIVQVNFTDKTEIILSSTQKIVTFVNQKKERSQHYLATALESKNVDMAKRLKYTKELLTHMLNGTSVNADSEVNKQLS